MKKFLALSLVLVMLLASAVAFAEDTKEVQLSLQLEAQYEWTVPDSTVTLHEPTAEKGGYDDKNAFEVKVTKFTAKGGKVLFLTFPNPTGNLSTEDGDTIPYTLSWWPHFADASEWQDCGTGQGQIGRVMFEGPYDEKFCVKMTDADIVTAAPGLYTGEITFKMEVADHPLQ